MTEPRSTVEPPRSLVASLAHLGPGIILASSIVGSGELIATTTAGAEAGFTLLWLILLGCVVKVAAQVEIGRTTLTWGRTPLDAFDRVSGPRLASRGWITWAWVVMTMLILVQQGGIVAGVAQTLAAGVPLSAAGRAWNEAHDELAQRRVAEATARRSGDAASAASWAAQLSDAEQAAGALPMAADETAWSVIVALGTAVLLAIGRYRLIERMSIVLVGTFTIVTLAALVMLQRDPAWAIAGSDLASGLIPSLPPAIKGRSPIVTALANVWNHRRGGERTHDLSLLVPREGLRICRGPAG